MTTRESWRQKQIAQVLDAIRSDNCNTSRDVADVTGLSIEQASSYISMLVADGILQRTGRTMPTGANGDRGPPYLVFELAPDVAEISQVTDEVRHGSD